MKVWYELDGAEDVSSLEIADNQGKKCYIDDLKRGILVDCPNQLAGVDRNQLTIFNEEHTQRLRGNVVLKEDITYFCTWAGARRQDVMGTVTGDRAQQVISTNVQTGGGGTTSSRVTSCWFGH